MAKATSVSDFRIVMIGKSHDEKTKLGTFLTAKSNVPYAKLSKQSDVFHGQWMRKSLTVFNSSDLLSADYDKVRDEVRDLISQCARGPNVLLLLVDPSDFTKTDRDKLKYVLRCFGKDAVKHSMVIVTKSDMGWNPQLNILKQDCGQRHLRLNFSELYGIVLNNLMDRVQAIVSDNQSPYEAFPGQSATSEPIYNEFRIQPVLNLVMCGSFYDWKGLAAKAILGQKQNASNSSTCVQNTGKVGRQTVSILELPSLSNKDTASHETQKCLSLCDPDGIHAFIMVQPVGPLTSEDRDELRTLQREFSSKMNAFKMILFTVDSESAASAVSNFIKTNKDLQELCESCNNRFVILNIKNKDHVQNVIRMVENISGSGSKSFTRQMTIKPRVNEKPNIPKKVLLSRESLRIVLIGKTGCGKSASANTILGRDEFSSKLSQSSVTRICKKAEGEIEGRPLVIVDTPGLFDTTLTNAEVQQELVKCVSLLAPGPHVFLLVLQIGRFTREEQETVHLIKEYFGNDSENFTMVLFTRGDNLRNTTLEEYLQGGITMELLQKCGNRYHVFNNNDKGNRRQVRELLSKIDVMMQRNGGGYFTSEIFQEAEAAIEKETERILLEKAPEIEKQRQIIQEKHKLTKSKFVALKNKIEQEIVQWGKQVREKQRTLALEQEKRKKIEERLVEEEQLWKMEEEQQVQKWNERYKNLQSQMDENKQWDEPHRRMSLFREEFLQETLELERRRTKKYEEDQQRLEEENLIFAILESEYEEAKYLYETKKREDQQRRQKEEEEWREVEQIYQKQLDEIKQKSMQQARKQAEEWNDFQHKYTREETSGGEDLAKELSLMKAAQKRNDQFILSHLKRSRSFLKEYNTMTRRHRQERTALDRLQGVHNQDYLRKGVEELGRQHEEELHLLIQERVRRASSSSACRVL